MKLAEQFKIGLQKKKIINYKRNKITELMIQDIVCKTFNSKKHEFV